MPPPPKKNLRTRDLVSQKMMQRHFISTLHPLSTVIVAAATVLAFVLLRDSRFNFHCCTQHEATPTQKSARKCTATSRDFLCERLQSALTLANQLCWIAHKWADENSKTKVYPYTKKWKHSINMLFIKSVNRSEHSMRHYEQTMSANPVLVYCGIW